MLCYKKNDDLVVAGIKPYSVRSEAKLGRILDKYFPINQISDDNFVNQNSFKLIGNESFNETGIWNTEKEINGNLLEDYLIGFTGVDGVYQFGSTLFEQDNKSFKNGNFVINNFDDLSLGYNFNEEKMAMLSIVGRDYYSLNEYKMLYPAITQFLAQTHRDNRISEESEKLFNLGSFDMTKLLDGGIDSLKDLRAILTKCDKKEALSILYKYFPKFAEFYYNVCPSIKVNPLNTYSLEQLKRLKNEVAHLQLDTSTFDRLIEQEEVAENNTKVLQLVNRVK